MEFLTILLSSLIGLIAPVGLVSDRIAASAIRDQIDAEDLQVRIDNVPTYRLLQGRIDRVRIAGRGLSVEPGFRIAALEVETDAIAVDPRSLREGEPELEQPLQAGVRVVLSQADLTQALRSRQVRSWLDDLNLGQFGGAGYEIRNPRIQLLDNNRIRLRAALRQADSDEQLTIVLESGLSILAGRQLQFDSPTATLNGDPLPDRIVAGFATGISQRFDLRTLQASGITARILKIEINPDQLQLAAFVRVEPGADLLSENAIGTRIATRSSN